MHPYSTMDSTNKKIERRKLVAFASPMVTFLILLSLVSGLKAVRGVVWLNSPEYWVYPAQTVICAALLLWFWREYHFCPPARLCFTIALAVFVFLLWISPQGIFGFYARRDGFNPDVFAGQPAWYWTTVLFRFLRLVLVVPLVEEIFWRGFLLRYLISEKFDAVPFGTFSWLSFAVVTAAFGLSHSLEDWAAALITGALYNFVAYRTRNLASCVIAHAVTNLFLGLWIMHTRQWGFW